MENKLFKMILIIGITFLFIGTSTPPSSGVTIQPTPIEYNELIVAYVFVIGTVKDPYYVSSIVGGYYFQVINITIIGMFWEDIANPYFGKYHLNDSWRANDIGYYGINQFRIIVNPPETAFICGILYQGDLLAEY